MGFPSILAIKLDLCSFMVRGPADQLWNYSGFIWASSDSISSILMN